jgi:hypothetical protein
MRMVKSHGGDVVLVVRDEIKVAQILNLEGGAIVGKFCGRRMSLKTVNVWMEVEWRAILGYIPICHLLSHGWMGVIFQTKTNVELIRAGCWY